LAENVTPDVPIVTFTSGDKADLKPGTKIFIGASKKPARVNYGKDGLTPPMYGAYPRPLWGPPRDAERPQHLQHRKYLELLRHSCFENDDSAGFNGQRITAARWDASLPPAEAAKRASRAIGWPELSADAIWLTGKTP
jgi:hypothetical protein